MIYAFLVAAAVLGISYALAKERGNERPMLFALKVLGILFGTLLLCGGLLVGWIVNQESITTFVSQPWQHNPLISAALIAWIVYGVISEGRKKRKS